MTEGDEDGEKSFIFAAFSASRLGLADLSTVCNYEYTELFLIFILLSLPLLSLSLFALSL